MPLQTDRLVLTALGIRGDVRPEHTVQPALRDGIHLRWAFQRERGFPWHGYYLFRRRTMLNEFRRCIANELGAVRPGVTLSSRYNTSIGRLTSDQPLTVTDLFPAVGVSEIDLRNRKVLRFDMPPGEPAWMVTYQIGFIAPQPQRICFDVPPLPIPLPKRTIDLPDASSLVEITLKTGARASIIVALDATGATVAKAEAAAKKTQTLSLSAKSIARIRVDGEVTVTRICYTRPAPQPAIRVKLFDGRTLLEEKTLQPAPGSTVTSGGHLFDRITSIEFSGGPAVLISLCYSAVTAGALVGWEPLDRTPRPIALPVFSSDYPCPGKPASLVDARVAALNRIAYDESNPAYAAGFDDMHVELSALVAGGPAAGAMADRERAIPATSSSTTETPVMPRQSPLDLCLLAALHPPLAQMLGLYWLDRTAETDVLYDYLIVADHDGVLPGNPKEVLSWLQTNGFGSVDASMAFAKSVMTQPPLAAPSDVRVYALPDGTGLNWTGGRDSVLYHLWRASLGEPTPAAEPFLASYALATTRGPVLPVRSYALPEEIAPPPEWPPFRNDAVERGLADGWYGYRVNGIDLFGRHSPLSAAATWWQWRPSDAVAHPYAVHVVDTIPPPPPTGLQAWLLDPRDPYVLRDAAYTTWRNSLAAAERDTLVGLRVRWEWPEPLALQAPDTREFRAYFNPGSALPAPNAAVAANWSAHISTVPIAATRTYEIFVPAPAGLTPSLANPVLYACVGVTAADARANESAVSTVAKVFIVLRDRPPRPDAAPDAERVFATPADYHAHSFYTYRWVPAPDLKAHIYRALDDSLFAIDRASRPRAAALTIASNVFPAEARWDDAKRQQVCDELNALDALPPAALTAACRALSNDALRVLASLPENAAAFTQVTTTPLDPGDAANANQRGPDNPDSFPIDPALRAYVDTLDGRSTNRFFYRYAHLDGAGNRSELSIASAPVWLPNVLPPLAPSVRSISGSDRQIELRWVSNKEAGLAEYRVHRADAEDDARDLRGMTLVATVSAESDPAQRPVEVLYSDLVSAGTHYWYRIVAVDTAGNVSAPSRPFDATAFRSDNPPAPDWSGAAWILSPAPRVRLEWTLLEPDLSVLVQRRDSEDGAWRAVSPWLTAGALTFEDTTADVTRDVAYRLRSRDPGGRMNRDFVQRLVVHP